MIDDPDSEFTEPDELAAMLGALLVGQLGSAGVVRVRRGGMLADKVMDELPPVRHKLMGRSRG